MVKGLLDSLREPGLRTAALPPSTRFGTISTSPAAGSSADDSLRGSVVPRRDRWRSARSTLYPCCRCRATPRRGARASLGRCRSRPGDFDRALCASAYREAAHSRRAQDVEEPPNSISTSVSKGCSLAPSGCASEGTLGCWLTLAGDRLRFYNQDRHTSRRYQRNEAFSKTPTEKRIETDAVS